MYNSMKDGRSKNLSHEVGPSASAAFEFHTSPEPPPLKKPRGALGKYPPASMSSSIGYARSGSNHPNLSNRRFDISYQRQNQNNQNNQNNDKISTHSVVDKAISTRRAELQKLKERLRPNSTSSSAKNSNNSRLLALAKTHLDDPLAGRKLADTKSRQVKSKSNSNSQLLLQKNSNAKTMKPPNAVHPLLSKSISKSNEKAHSTNTPKQTEQSHETFPDDKKKLNSSPFYNEPEFDDPDYSMLVTPKPININTNSESPSLPHAKSTILHPRKLNLSSSTKPIEHKSVAVPSLQNEENAQINNETDYLVKESMDDNKPLSTTSSQDTKETSHKQIPSPHTMLPPSSLPPSNIAPHTITTTSLKNVDVSVLNISPTTLKDPVKLCAEKALKDGTPIDSKRGLLYALGKYASDNQSINSNSNHQITNISTYTEGLSTITDIDIVDNRSVSTRGSTSSQNTRRLVLQLREANEEKSAALRDVARLEAELENRIRTESSPLSSGLGMQHKTKRAKERSEDGKASARNGALAMLICITEKRVEKVKLRHAWNKWKTDILNIEHEKSPFRTNKADNLEPNLYSVPSSFYSSGGVHTPLSMTRIHSAQKNSNNKNNHDRNTSSVVSTPVSTSSSRRYRHIKRSPLPSRPSNITSIPKSFLQQAFASVPKEFSSSMGEYIIRTPETFSSSPIPTSYLSKDVYSVMPQDVYDEVIDPGIPETLEIRANITADESVLIVYGEMSIRHIKKDGLVIREVENVDDFGLLGFVPHIDCDGIENEYSLDEIYEEAIASRISYCDSLLSAALVLQTVNSSTNENTRTNPTFSPMTTIQKKETNDIAPPSSPFFKVPVESNANVTTNVASSTFPPMNDLSNMRNNNNSTMPNVTQSPPFEENTNIQNFSNTPAKKNLETSHDTNKTLKTLNGGMNGIPPHENSAHSGVSLKQSSRIPPNISKSESPTKVKENKNESAKKEERISDSSNATGTSDSSQMLTSLLSFVVGSIFRIIGFFCIKIPWKIMRRSFYYIFLTSILMTVWIYFAEDNGAGMKGSMIEECNSLGF